MTLDKNKTHSIKEQFNDDEATRDQTSAFKMIFPRSALNLNF